MNKQLVRLLLIFVVVLVGSGLLVYVLLEHGGNGSGTPVTERTVTTTDQSGNPTASPGGSVPVQRNGNRSVISELFGIDAAERGAHVEAERSVVAARVLIRFLLAAFLAMLLAYRWRRGLSITKRNPYVAQTQILLAVVAAAMMMIERPRRQR